IAVVSDNGMIINLNIGGVDDFLPDSTVLGTVGVPDNVLTGNGFGTGMGGAVAFTTLNNGTITGSIVNNSMHNSAANSISFTSNTGMTTLTSIQNNTLNDNGLAGIFVTGTGGTVNAGTIANNNFDRLISGTSGLLVNATGASFTATVVRNSFIADPVANTNTEFGIGIDMQDGALNLNVGSFFPSDANIFDLNNGAGIGITLRQTATGTFDIRQNSITRTGNLASNADFNGEGIHIRLVGAAALPNSTATLTNSFIRNNTIGSLTDAAMGNASHGIAINVQEDTVLQNLDITDNAIGNNGLDGINFLRRDDAVVDAVNIANNTITLNGDDGIDISARNGSNDVADFTILNNQITDNVNRGIALDVQADASLRADITDNTITGQGSHGIVTSEVANSVNDLRNVTGTWTNNIITDNGGNGILLDGSTSLLTIGQAGVGNGNLVSNNSLAGFLVTAPGSVVIENNIITFNGAGLSDIRVGAGIDIEGPGFKNTTLTNNVIRENFGDGLEFNNNSFAGGFSFTLTATGNTIEFNQGRGVDILNQGTADSTMTFNNNKVASNSLEGFYVVNTASTTQTQNVDSTVALLADGLINAIPRLTLNMDNNQIIKNGDGTTFSTTGLVIRVGTSDGGSFDFTDPGGFANGGRGGVVALVKDHTFGGNFGDDVLFESFVSTVTPAVTAGTWNLATFDVTAFESEPLARLDLTYISNTVDSTDANNLGAFFNNAEILFKSRDTLQTDPGPFPVGGTRRRNAQRLAARNVDILGTLLPPTLPGGLTDSDTFLYSGMGLSTFRISTTSSMTPFILDDVPYVDYPDANGVNFTTPLFGELPFGWGQFTP
ncbi:MAG: right-handed parallel beta-helix repeat-containing protein, partial [Planctomycetes bacterium]|nr:right-handed parallel beta-helix repeat-containing protein [Planctomycetota bacterium]